MSRRVWFALLAAAGAVGISACALPVTIDAAPGYSVANCRTYTFADEHLAGGEHGAYGNPLNADRVRVAIQGQMYARGIPEVARNQADCIVGYALGTRQVIDEYYAGWGAGWGWGWRRGWWGYDEPWVYDETRIAIDFFDARAHKPIWHGAVSLTDSDLRGPNAEARLNAAVAAIFGKVPLPARYAPPPGYVPPPPQYPPPGYAPPAYPQQPGYTPPPAYPQQPAPTYPQQPAPAPRYTPPATAPTAPPSSQPPSPAPAAPSAPQPAMPGPGV